MLCHLHRSHRGICTRNRPISETKFVDDVWGPFLSRPLCFDEKRTKKNKSGRTNPDREAPPFETPLFSLVAIFRRRLGYPCARNSAIGASFALPSPSSVDFLVFLSFLCLFHSDFRSENSLMFSRVCLGFPKDQGGQQSQRKSPSASDILIAKKSPILGP